MDENNIYRGLHKMYCSQCGSSDVDIRVWVNPNTHTITQDPLEVTDIEDCWCNNCEEHTEIKTLEELWNDFSDVEVDADDNIETDFLNFEAGTSKFDVWHWFDDRCPNNLHDDLLNI